MELCNSSDSGCAEMGSVVSTSHLVESELHSHTTLDNKPVHLGNYLVRHDNYLVTCSLLSTNSLLLQRLSSYSPVHNLNTLLHALYASILRGRVWQYPEHWTLIYHIFSLYTFAYSKTVAVLLIAADTRDRISKVF